MLTPGGVFRGPFAMVPRSYVASVEETNIPFNPDAELLVCGDKAAHQRRADTEDA